MRPRSQARRLGVRSPPAGHLGVCRHFGVKAGDEVAVVGLGGLGHVGVRMAKAMGARVTVLSHSPGKGADARALGADDFVATKDPAVFATHAGRFDFVLDTVSATHDYNAYLGLLKRDRTMVLVGAPDPSPLSAMPLLFGRRRLAGSLIGGIRETQEMLDFSAEHGVLCDVEVIPIDRINEAYDRVVRSDVRYRFVIAYCDGGAAITGSGTLFFIGGMVRRYA